MDSDELVFRVKELENLIEGEDRKRLAYKVVHSFLNFVIKNSLFFFNFF